MSAKGTTVCHPERKHYAFGQCRPCYIKDNRHRFPSTNPATRQKVTPERSRGHKLKEKFGITEADFDRMLEAQGGTCAICDGPPGGRWNRYCVDHDHATGRIRGLLCLRCNRAIGLLADRPEVILRAAEYLLFGELASRP